MESIIEDYLEFANNISNQKLKDLGWKINVKFEEGIEKLI